MLFNITISCLMAILILTVYIGVRFLIFLYRVYKDTTWLEFKLEFLTGGRYAIAKSSKYSKKDDRKISVFAHLTRWFYSNKYPDSTAFSEGERASVQITELVYFRYWRFDLTVKVKQGGHFKKENELLLDDR